MQGDRLGPYRLERELGSGGMGKVWAATVEGRCPGLAEGTRVALKVVHRHLLETPGFFKRFLREAEIGKSVVHGNVVRTFDADAALSGGAQQNFLVMEYVEGQTLRSLLAELERVPEELCRHVGREVAKGLAAIHAAGVVHRDLKPENVLITGDQHVKVMDLGVARLAEESLRLSRSGEFVGSVEYAAPEQFGGAAVDFRADLHALGLVLYELGTGQHPYRGDDFRTVMRRIVAEVPRRVGDVNPQLSPFFDEVVHTLLAKEPGDRFADAPALLAVLEAGETSEWWKVRAKAIRAATRRPLRRIRIPRETAVYGRENEMAALRSLYDAAKAGDGRVVVIEGEAGIGKSRLVDELVGRLQRDGEDPYFLFGSYPPGGAATAAGAFSTAFREHLGETDLADAVRDRLGVASTLAPAFAALLLGAPPPAGAEPLTKESLQTCFVHVARSLAAERPTVVLIDDLHFATEDARALFASLALAVPGHRLLLVGTTRPGIDGKWLSGLTRLEQTSQIAVPRLGPKDLVALLRDSFRSDALAAALSAQIAMKSDGNPFFAFEIIRGLREGQFITRRDDGTWVTTRVIGDIAIPSSVLDLVNARVSDLTADERNLLDVAACWGFEFDPLVVGEAVGLARIPVLRALGQIERHHRLVRSQGRSYAFDHHQVQEALYGALNEYLREEYHAALASALETRTNAAEKDPRDLDGALCVDLCEHFLRGAQGERALRYLAAAQSHLRRGYLPAQSAALAERALAVPGLLSGPRRANTLIQLCPVLESLGRWGRMEECAREAERLAEESGDDEIRGRAALELGRALSLASRPAEAEVPYRRALETARARGDRRTETGAELGLGNTCSHRGRLAEAMAHHERALAIAREVGDRGNEATATGNLGGVCSDLGRLAEADAFHTRHLALAREIRDRTGEVRAIGNLAILRKAQGRMEEAAECNERACTLAREIGARALEANAIGFHGTLHLARGRLAEAQACHERHLALAREMGDQRGEAAATVNLGAVCFARGRLAEAVGHCERGVALGHATGHRGLVLTSLANLGVLRLRLGVGARARDALLESLAISREIGSRQGVCRSLDALAALADDEGDRAESLRLVREALDIYRATGGGDGLADCLIALADLQRRSGQVDDARAAAEEALALARQQGRDADVAHALALLANLPGGDARAAAQAADAGRESMDVLAVRLLLWQATGDRVHLVAARAALDERLTKNPPEFHESMRRNVRVNREILAACEAQGIG